ncbi:MAG: glycosyltransferase family 2 protein [Fimbriiglobus sp.]
MTFWTLILGFVGILTVFPALLYFRNTRFFRPPPVLEADEKPFISVLIPARNEEKSIEAAARSIMASEGVEWELIILDDHSTDTTAEIVRRLGSEDGRVRVESAPALPEGWCGKQHACYQLSRLAKYDLLTFLDADVRLTPTALARMVAFQRNSQASLVSGFPRQETGTLLEKLVIPLIHWLLLSFLPFDRMRNDLRPALGAGCGQWFLTTRTAYEQSGGHAAIRGSLHDGVKLPRSYRAQGLMTDLCDVTDLATCRMYTSASQVWYGLAKNAGEGLGSAKLIGPFTVLLYVGQVLPFLLWLALPALEPWQVILLAVLNIVILAPRLHAAVVFQQSWLGALLHPIGILLLLSIQWFALIRSAIGKPVGWKGRAHPTTQIEVSP